jgi:hypothetical protein
MAKESGMLNEVKLSAAEVAVGMSTTRYTEMEADHEDFAIIFGYVEFDCQLFVSNHLFRWDRLGSGRCKSD